MGSDKPLSIEEVDLAGPKAGEVLVRIVATGRLPYRRVYLIRRRSGGTISSDPGSRRRRHRGGGRCRRHQRQGWRSCDSPVHARMRYLRVLPVGQNQFVPANPRDPGQRRHAGRHIALLVQGQADFALYGNQHILRAHRPSGDLGGEHQSQGAAGKGLPARLRHHNRHWRGAEYRKSYAGRNRGCFWSRRHWPVRGAGRGDGQGFAHHRRRSESRANGPWPRHSAPPITSIRRTTTSQSNRSSSI